MNLFRISAALIFFALLLVSFSLVEAEKEPVWTWSSASPITNTAISSDSRNISATYGQSVSLWKNDTTYPYNPYNSKTEGDGIRYMAMSSDGKYVITGEEGDKTLTLREVGSKLWDKSNFLLSLNGIDISDDGNNITAVDARNIYFLNKGSSSEVWNVNLAPQEMTTVSISPDGRYIAAGTYDGNVYVYLTDQSDNWYHSGSLDGKTTVIDFSADSSHLIIGTASGRVHVYPSVGGDPVTMLQPNTEVTCVSAGLDSRYYVYGTDSGMLTVFDKEIASDVWQKSFGNEIVDCSFNGKGTYVIAGSDTKILLLANTTSGDEVWRTITGSGINSVSLSYKGENIVVGTESGLLLYYEQLLDNQAPIAFIDVIEPSIALPGEDIFMSGSATDYDGIVINYLWHSSLDGNISSMNNFTISNLSMGLHLISFSVQDNEDRWSALATMQIGVGDFPDVSILSINLCVDIEDCIIDLEEEIIIEASATSKTSENITMESYEWLSDLDGLVSHDLTFNSSSLSLGTHTLTFRAKNSVGFWSANVSVIVIVNGVPSITIDNVDPNPVIAGEEAKVSVAAFDADGDKLSYFWSTESVSLYFADNRSTFATEDTDYGEHVISVYVQDSKGAVSNMLNITIDILSLPIVNELVCDSEVNVNQEALFTVFARKPQGSIVKYEWDFDSSSGNLDSVDSIGFDFATHSYNSSTEDEDGYRVVVRVTDNDGLTARGSCRVIVLEEGSSKSKSSGEDVGFVSKLTSTTGLIGLVFLFIGAGGLVYYFNRDNFDSYKIPESSTSAAITSTNSSSRSLIEEEQEEEPRKKTVRKRKVVHQSIPEMMTVECPQCSSQIEIPKISGSQQLQCPDCGLEGEIDI